MNHKSVNNVYTRNKFCTEVQKEIVLDRTFSEFIMQCVWSTN